MSQSDILAPGNEIDVHPECLVATWKGKPFHPIGRDIEMETFGREKIWLLRN